MESLAKKYDKVLKKQRTMEQKDPLDDLISVVNEAKEKIHQDPSTMVNSLEDLAKNTKTMSASITKDYKDIQNALSKYSKSLDKKLSAERMTQIRSNVFENKEDIQRKVVGKQLFCQGNSDAALLFAMESGTDTDETTCLAYKELADIVGGLKTDNLEPALLWARRHRAKLEQRSSTLEFKLLQQKYLQLLRRQQPLEAVSLARQNFGYYANNHLHEISRLMCCILYMDQIESSPYSDLWNQGVIENLRYIFPREYFGVMDGAACESPLYTSTMVGHLALSKMSRRTDLRRATSIGWNLTYNLPFEANLTDDCKFHSIFVCPISKEASSQENPPMMMVCGHVISQECLLRLSRGNSRQFKCPYCPTMSMASQASQIHF
ncbi:MAG: CTLH/CRA C-terminal to lish motif domain-containing protein [Benniella sp.]|nr:MAG: CTLH/CRA C-terminal to lish motif domain-containing protein [Benniella sp.]